VVVALVGDDHAPLVVYGHDAGVLHRAHDHIGGVGGKELLEAGAGALVGAVLGPHGIIAEQLGEGGIAAQHLGNGERFGHRHAYARSAQTGLYFWIGQTDYLQFGNTSGKLGVCKAGRHYQFIDPGEGMGDEKYCLSHFALICRGS